MSEDQFWTSRSTCKSCTKAQSRDWKRAHPEETVRQRRKHALRHKYGMSLEEWDALFERQGGLCAVAACGRTATHVDHCHRSDAVRALTCSQCNSSLGLLGEDPARIRSLARYAEYYC